eukprot:gnl/TRDRNA2_/TRDRNA2_199728_c0_seq1.p1 gnl/TRDRNA2_/TRDRNA2_199728_c0~~gnl/TRDRNA2_/TRDRNA2_199728_c0_seq1.p1  ORF type:complete len:590 (+),score=107.02 gnl/TRDRNA2_/TRDRNA2_199728_c0_seq1:64-1833(+)
MGERDAQDMIADAAMDPGPTKPAADGYDAANRNKLCKDFEDGDWKTFYDFIPDNADTFLLPVDGRKPLTYKDLRSFLLDPKHDILGLGREDRLCAALPNGPESATVYLVYCLRCTFAPLNLLLRAEEYEFEFADLPAKGLIVQQKDKMTDDEQRGTGVAVAAARKSKLTIIMELVPSKLVTGMFDIQKHAAGKPPKGDALGPPLETVKREHICLVLHTSGTTKKPKIVPLSHGNMANGCKCHAAVDKFTKDDVFVNTMPMFHIAGLWENMMTTIFSGAKMIAIPGIYQAHNFYKYLTSEPHPTCYSAVPTQHLSLMQFAREMEKADKEPFKCKLQAIRNDSAALVPSLALEMEDYLKATVMPAYSMTEACPIASNPRYGPRKLKSVGPTVGPDLQIMEAFPSNKVLPAKEMGEVCVKGACVQRGYEMRPHMDQDPNLEAFTDGFMRTGDKGWLDEDGYLYLVGRFKELINRAGEKVSPFEVEDACRKHTNVKDALCFSCPHEMLGESVGVVVTLKDSSKEAMKAFELREFLMGRNLLADKWCPEVVVTMPEIPKGPTGKPARINLAKKLEMKPLNGTVYDMAHPGLPAA